MVQDLDGDSVDIGVDHAVPAGYKRKGDLRQTVERVSKEAPISFLPLSFERPCRNRDLIQSCRNRRAEPHEVAVLRNVTEVRRVWLIESPSRRWERSQTILLSDVHI